MNILLSIKPEWASLIYEGKKTIEWRKSYPSQFVSNETKVFLYETAPVHKVTGYFTLEAVMFAGVAVKEGYISQSSIDKGCVKINDLKKYLGTSSHLYGWEVSLPHEYSDHKNLSDFGINQPPQSWCYIKETV